LSGETKGEDGMGDVKKTSDSKSQSDKFKKAARELECDEDEKHWDERLRKVAKGKPSSAAGSDDKL